MLARIDIASMKLRDEKPRSYIGASSIGDPCLAYQALNMRGFPSSGVDAKKARVFENGHIIEGFVISLLKGAGYTVEELDPTTSKQWHYEAAGGHVCANLDGKIALTPDGLRLLLEVKTMNDKRFAAFVSKGVRVSDPKYYAQMQFGMSLSQTRCALIVVYNKNTSEIAVEFVDVDDGEVALLTARAGAALNGDAKRISMFKDAFACKGCFKREACWNGAQPEELKCGHCAHARPLADRFGGWLCSKTGTPAVSVCHDFKLFKVTPC